ncbi:MAG: hypothetical protein COS41_03245 [Elusimicrobia bacterium CG03_land_8_20_14_0_80_50_18]|nr:MAG: hypothetical protein COS41_03245 [Elusimicrobia bacterium CG03_land_8_20_14_0_80_50_18]PIX13684.1 MAG: hypothetical protein COZ72_08025 [Elusimicrobia bacterium CG_4_8_14_3_um_filter_50_9]
MRIKRKFKVAVRRGNTRGLFILLFIIASLTAGYLYIRDRTLREQILKVRGMRSYSESDKEHIIETIKCGVPISVAEYTLRQEKKRAQALKKKRQLAQQAEQKAFGSRPEMEKEYKLVSKKKNMSRAKLKLIAQIFGILDFLDYSIRYTTLKNESELYDFNEEGLKEILSIFVAAANRRGGASPEEIEEYGLEGIQDIKVYKSRYAR